MTQSRFLHLARKGSFKCVLKRVIISRKSKHPMTKPLLMMLFLVSVLSLNVNHELAAPPSTDDLLDHEIIDHEEVQMRHESSQLMTPFYGGTRYNVNYKRWVLTNQPGYELRSFYFRKSSYPYYFQMIFKNGNSVYNGVPYGYNSGTAVNWNIPQG